LPNAPVTARTLLDLVAKYVRLTADAQTDEASLQSLVQRFDVAIGEYIVEAASIQNEG